MLSIMRCMIESILFRPDVEHHFVNIAPAPVFAWLEGLDDGMVGSVVVFGGVPVL